jgi:hypothetical protein
MEDIMTTEQKIIRAKIRLPEAGGEFEREIGAIEGLRVLSQQLLALFATTICTAR